MVRLSAIQICSTPNVERNINTIDALLKTLPTSTEHIVVLPECCLFFGGTEEQQLSFAKKNQINNLAINALSALAKRYQLYLVAGSIPLLCDLKHKLSHNSNVKNEHDHQIASTTHKNVLPTKDKIHEKFTNSCLVFAPSGDLLQRYDKIHLFDANVSAGEKKYVESTYTQAGKKLSIAVTQSTQIGLSICYDLRFPELYRQLRLLGADIITVPSAFTATTGKAHWQALLQARAIENQVYIIAAGQQGIHENGRETWGHSMIISPYGEIQACAPDGECVISTTYSPEALAKIRQSMPITDHNKFTSKLTPYE